MDGAGGCRKASFSLCVRWDVVTLSPFPVGLEEVPRPSRSPFVHALHLLQAKSHEEGSGLLWTVCAGQV